MNKFLSILTVTVAILIIAGTVDAQNEHGGITFTPKGSTCLMTLPEDGTVTTTVPGGKVIYYSLNRQVIFETIFIPVDGLSFEAVWPGTTVTGLIWSGNNCSISSFPASTPVPTEQATADLEVQDDVLYGTLTSGDCFVLLPGWGAIYNYDTQDYMQRLSLDEYMYPFSKGNGLVNLYLSYYSNGYNLTQDVVVNTDDCSRFAAVDPVSH